MPGPKETTAPQGEEDLTESGRPRVARPMPDTSTATHCPHCNAEVGGGHYVCWNCSKDIRMKEQTEDEILTEYHWMLARDELRLEARNQRFFLTSAIIAVVFGIIGFLLDFRIGSVVLFGLFAALFVMFFRRSKAREGRIRDANDL